MSTLPNTVLSLKWINLDVHDFDYNAKLQYNREPLTGPQIQMDSRSIIVMGENCGNIRLLYCVYNIFKVASSSDSDIDLYTIIRVTRFCF
jgi:hypothetical protein